MWPAPLVSLLWLRRCADAFSEWNLEGKIKGLLAASANLLMVQARWR